MTQVNIFQAKTDLSKLIAMLEDSTEDYITIARAGKPVAMLVPFSENKKKSRIGAAKGEILYTSDINEADEEIAALFGGSSL